MHKEILSENQLELLPLIKRFIREYYLVGGTAIGLHIGHRRSIDFNLYEFDKLKPEIIVSEISSFKYPFAITRKIAEQMNVTIHDVKFTFCRCPFQIDAIYKFEDYLRFPELIDLAAMKAYALGRRSKWKDYVDLYFILKYYYSVGQISQKVNEIYGQLFSTKLFRARLAYFKDVDYSEPIEFLLPVVTNNEIRSFLVDKATDIGLF